MKKLLTTACVLVLLLSLLAISVCAEGSAPVMTVDGKEYTDFEEGWNDALAATANNDNTVEVVLLADWTAENGSFGSGKGFKKGAIYISEDTKDMSLDLNGHTIDRGLFLWSDFNSDPEKDKGRDSGEVMHIDEGSKRITVKGGTITGANNKDYGGIYIDKAEVLFENMTFVSNKSDQGGALYNNEGRVSFVNCIFERNKAEYGGAVYTDYDVLVFDGCTFRNNVGTNEYGATIYSYDADTTISNCILESNRGIGVAITTLGLFDTGDVVVKNTTFDNHDWAIYLRDGSLEVYGSTFKNNKTACQMLTRSKFYDCTFTGNQLAIYASKDIWLDGCTIEDNHYDFDGSKDNAYGTVHLTTCTGYLSDTTIRNNTGHSGLYMRNSGTSIQTYLKLSGTITIDNNTTPGGDASNIAVWRDDVLGSIQFADHLSKDSIVKFHMENPYEEMYAVTHIYEDWTNADLNKVFSIDPAFMNYNGKDQYLKRNGENLEYVSGDYTKDSNAILNAGGSGAGTISTEGSLSILLALLAVAVSACSLTMVLVQKKKGH